jgi:hypothetical protein
VLLEKQLDSDPWSAILTPESLSIIIGGGYDDPINEDWKWG